ncbi:MAG: hypothetical protein LC803_03420 [Acidobacteria bacterium]|nr:hypothetical protein [Acidobacteriota bacterium]
MKTNGCPAPASPINQGASGSGSDEGSSFVVCDAAGGERACCFQTRPEAAVYENSAPVADVCEQALE